MAAAVLVERRGDVGVVTLNRPEKLNALNSPLIDDLEQALAALDADDQIGAIVITGAGERAFSAGGDMAETVAAMDDNSETRQGSLTRSVLGCRTPTLAAIRGYCYGGGALLAISCDIRIGGSDARIKFPGAAYGRPLGGALLPRIIGEAKAKELLFTADDVPAAEALRIGLLNQVVEPAQVLEYTVAMAARIAANSPFAIRDIKQTIDHALPIDKALEHEAHVHAEASHSTDSAARFREAAERVIGIRPAPRAGE
jgi:enoyl-CoA hydratase